MAEEQAGPIVATVKIVLVGEPGTGAKTSLYNRYTKGEYSDSVAATIGMSFALKRAVIDGDTFLLQIVGLFLLSLEAVSIQRAKQ